MYVLYNKREWISQVQGQFALGWAVFIRSHLLGLDQPSACWQRMRTVLDGITSRFCCPFYSMSVHARSTGLSQCNHGTLATVMRLLPRRNFARKLCCVPGASRVWPNVMGPFCYETRSVSHGGTFLTGIMFWNAVLPFSVPQTLLEPHWQ